MHYTEKYQLWLEKATQYDVQQALADMANDERKIENCFYKDLEFGTGGLRGVMDAGTNCMNYYTVAKATFGIVKYMIAHDMHSVAVAYDSRRNSAFFAETVARVFATHGIHCFVSEVCVPTPFLSFATRNLHCDIGINITASHNPAEYNGYKVYGGDGCQITDNVAEEITRHIESTNPFQIELESAEKLYKENRIEKFPDALAQQYLQYVLQQSLGNGNGVKVAYSPLNGTGYHFVVAVLKKIGVDALHCVQSQIVTDGSFSTCPKPNPELDETLKAVIDLANENCCDVAIATDPDCDRLGVVVKHNGGYVRLTGNEVGIVLSEFILQRLKAQNSLPKDGIIVKTIVTSSLIEKIAENYGMKTVNLLTGFKYIGEKIGQLEKAGETDRFVFGFEESCGYLRGSYVRDKDGVFAAMLAVEAVAYFKRQGQTFVDVLEQLYTKYGRYQHKLVSYRFEGADGAAKKQQLLDNLRQNGIKTLADSKVTTTIDYLSGGELPPSNVLQYKAQDGSQIIVRPSGTEPLIKTYITVCGDAESNNVKMQSILKLLNEMFAM